MCFPWKRTGANGGQKVRYVLVHGAWHGAWCWEVLASRLRARGHEVAAPDLPAQGDHPAEARDVTHEDVVDSIVAELDSESILVGHSLGGYWIDVASARAPQHVAKLVHLATAVSNRGELWVDTMGRSGMSLELPAADLALGAIPPPKDPVAAFYQLCPAERAAAASARLRPLPTRPLDAARAPDRDFEGPRLAVLCRDDRAFPIEGAERCAREAGVPSITIDGDHSPFYSNVERLAEILEGGDS